MIIKVNALLTKETIATHFELLIYPISLVGTKCISLIFNLNAWFLNKKGIHKGVIEKWIYYYLDLTPDNHIL